MILHIFNYNKNNGAMFFCFWFLGGFFCLFFILFIYYFWLRWVFVAACGLSLVEVSGGYSSLRCAGATLHCSAQASHCSGSSCCKARVLGTRASVVVARGLSSCGSQALEHRLISCGAWATACGIFPDQGPNPCSLH